LVFGQEISFHRGFARQKNPLDCAGLLALRQAPARLPIGHEERHQTQYPDHGVPAGEGNELRARHRDQQHPPRRQQPDHPAQVRGRTSPMSLGFEL